jgi:hypothetical protein
MGSGYQSLGFLARLEFERLIVELFGFIGISLALTLEHS